MNCFYDKEIEIYTYSSVKDENGTNRKEWIKANTDPDPLLVDVQPYNMTLANRDYGYQLECTKRIFMDSIPDLTESAVIKYNSQFYKIQKIIDWDTDVDVICLERDDIKVNG